MTSEQQKHKPGPLKQKNKPHKFGRHRTKGIIDNSNRGKLNVKTVTKKNRVLDKQQKRHQARHLRKNKWEETIAEKRKLSSDISAPHVVAIFLLSKSCCIEEVLNVFQSSDESIEFVRKHSQIILISKKHKQRFIVLLPNHNNLFALLDAAKVADTFLFISSAADGELDGLSDSMLSCLISQGLPSAVHVVQGLQKLPVKKQSDVKKNLTKKLEKWFPETKLHSIDSKQDGGIVLRQIYNQKIKKIGFRENRPYILVDRMTYETCQEEDQSGELKVCGYLKGRPLSVNALLHLPGLGERQMKQIERLEDPYALNHNKHNKQSSMEFSCESSSLVIDVEDKDVQESLQTEADVDPMEGEQTWPTDEELQLADFASKSLKGRTMKKVVPKGTSDYQASWILDDIYEQDDDDDDYEDDDDYSMDGEYEAHSDIEDIGKDDEEELETISIAPSTIVNDEKYDQNMDMEQEKQELEKYRLEHENDMFPDEIDTPLDIPARDRFIKYRGLKSFRTSPWDPKENLPLNYARIFQFQHFARTKKKVLANSRQNSDDEINDKLAQPGSYIQISIKDVPQQYARNIENEHPLVIFGLLPFEQKMTVMNYVIKRHPCSDIPIKSKDKLIFHVGYRRFSTNPIFSQHTTGDKFKMERFLKHDTAVVATVYAPIMFPPSPVLVFTENHELVAIGTVLNSNPNRVIVKKIVLSGHPFKINKKSSVVRYMFFNRDDILWFKPVELYTKYGRRGHIKEPLGTHGHMKCVFDGPLKAQDTVCMNLYKRQFPKWTYDLAITSPNVINPISDDINNPIPNNDAEM